MIEQNGEIMRKLKDYFEKCDDVVMAFLFGSFAKGQAVYDSDVDIAVYFKPEKRRIESEEDKIYPGENQILEDVEKIIKRNVDLVILNKARPLVAFDVLQTGMPIIIKNRPLYWNFYSLIHSSALDFMEFSQDYRRVKERSNSLSETDKERLFHLTEFLVEEIKSYEDFKNLDWKEYSCNRHIKRDVEHWLENIVNASIDIVKIILASEKLPRPETYKDTMKSLEVVKGEFDKKTAEKLSEFTGLRNIITHEYMDIRWRQIQGFIKTSRSFYEYLIEFVKKNYLK